MRRRFALRNAYKFVYAYGRRFCVMITPLLNAANLFCLRAYECVCLNRINVLQMIRQ